MTLLTLGTMRFLRDRGLDRSVLARVVVAQREWAARNPRALRRDPITVDAVLDAPLVAYPFTRPMCCVATDAGGAVVVTSAERARDLPRPPVHVRGTGEANGAAMASQMPDLTSSDAFRRAGAAAFADAGVTPADIDHAMLYDAAANIPLMALEDLGFVPRGDSGAFVTDGHTAIGGRLPVNTNGGGLNYTHSGMYGMYALQESIRQLRGEARGAGRRRDHLPHAHDRRHVPSRRHRDPLDRPRLRAPDTKLASADQLYAGLLTPVRGCRFRAARQFVRSPVEPASARGAIPRLLTPVGWSTGDRLLARELVDAAGGVFGDLAGDVVGHVGERLGEHLPRVSASCCRSAGSHLRT